MIDFSYETCYTMPELNIIFYLQWKYTLKKLMHSWTQNESCNPLYGAYMNLQ